MRSSDLAGNGSACLFSSLSQWKKGWVTQTAASASGLGPGSVSTLFFAPLGTCVSLGRSCILPPTFAPSFQQGSPQEVRDLRSVLKKQTVGEETRKGKVLHGMRREKGQGLQGRSPSSPPSSRPVSPLALPLPAPGAGPRSPEGICGHGQAPFQPSLRSEVQLE